jgi:hypothetical protein
VVVDDAAVNARAAAVGIALALVAGTARADRDKAAAAYKKATADFARGAFTDAAASFDTAFAEDPHGASAYNAALSWQSAHDGARAADDFARALAAGDLAAPLVENAKKQLAVLEATLGRVSIAGPADARFTVGSTSGAPSAVVHLAPGHYSVHATFAGGTSADFPVDVAAGGQASVTVAPPAAPPPPPAPTPEVTQRAGVLGPATLPISIGLIGAGVVAGGFAIGLGIATLDALDAYKQTGYTSQSAHDHATELRDWTNVAFVSALVLGAAGIGALVTVHRVKVHAVVGLGSIGLVGSF